MVALASGEEHGATREFLQQQQFSESRERNARCDYEEHDGERQLPERRPTRRRQRRIKTELNRRKFTFVICGRWRLKFAAGKYAFVAKLSEETIAYSTAKDVDLILTQS